MTNVVVTLPLSGEDAFTTGVQIRQAEFSHELAVISLPEMQAGTDFTQGTPVHVFYTDDGRGGPREFYGYVDTVTQAVSANTTPSSAVCVGMTWPLKEARQDVWVNVTADGIAETMAARWRLGADLDFSPRRWPSLPQAGVSDWTLLADLAREVGFTLYPRGPLLCFHERTREMSRLHDAAPVFLYEPHDPKSSIISFTPQTSTSVGGNVRQQIAVLDSGGTAFALADDEGTRSLLTSIDTQPTFTSVNTRTATDALEANQILTAHTEDNRFHIRATVLVAGDTRLRPAMPVYLGGLPPQWNGLWFVLNVVHDIAPQSNRQHSPDFYRCSLTVGRDGMGVSDTMPMLSDVLYDIEAEAEIGPSGLWQCGPMPILAPEDLPPSFVLERLARNG